MESLIGLVLGGSGTLYMWVGGLAATALAFVMVYLKGGKANEAKHTKSRLDGMKESQERGKEIDNADKDAVVGINTRPK